MRFHACSPLNYSSDQDSFQQKKAEHQLGNSSRGEKSPNTCFICFGSLLNLSFFSKICRMVIGPVRETYNHVVAFFAQERKQRLSLANPATFAIAKCPISFKFRISLKKYAILIRDGDLYNYDARLASLIKGIFILELAKKYLYVVTCTSDGTYNHLTYFREK